MEVEPDTDSYVKHLNSDLSNVENLSDMLGCDPFWLSQFFYSQSKEFQLIYWINIIPALKKLTVLNQIMVII